MLHSDVEQTVVSGAVAARTHDAHTFASPLPLRQGPQLQQQHNTVVVTAAAVGDEHIADSDDRVRNVYENTWRVREDTAHVGHHADDDDDDDDVLLLTSLHRARTRAATAADARRAQASSSPPLWSLSSSPHIVSRRAVSGDVSNTRLVAAQPAVTTATAATAPPPPPSSSRRRRHRADMTPSRGMLAWVSVLVGAVSLLCLGTAASLPALYNDDGSNNSSSNNKSKGDTVTLSLSSVRPVAATSAALTTTTMTTTTAAAAALQTLLRPPPSVRALETALLWCGVGAAVVAALGVCVAFTSPRTHTLPLPRVHMAAALLVAALALAYVVVAVRSGFARGDVSSIVALLDDAHAQLLRSHAGRRALRVLHRQQQCTGLQLCCASNTTPIALDTPLLLLHMDAVYSPARAQAAAAATTTATALHTVPPAAQTSRGAVADNKATNNNNNNNDDDAHADWRGVCYATLPSGDKVNRTGHNVTAQVQRECGDMYTKKDDSSNSNNSSGSDSDVDDDNDDKAVVYSTPCGDYLVGRVTTTLSFALTALFAVGVLCLTCVYLAIVVRSGVTT